MPIGVDRETVRAAVKHESGSVRRGVSRSGVIDPDPLRSRVREALWRLPDPCLIRRHQSASALPWRPPPCQRDSLADRDRPHALAPGDHRLCPPTYRRGLVEKGHHPLPEALRRSRDLPRTDRRPQSRCGVRRGCLTWPCSRCLGLPYEVVAALAAARGRHRTPSFALGSEQQETKRSGRLSAGVRVAR